MSCSSCTGDIHARFQGHENEADALVQTGLVQTGATAADDHLDRRQWAAWTLVANLVLNLDEVVTKKLNENSTMDPLEQHRQAISRRHFFQQGAVGLGTAALSSLLPGSLQANVTMGATGLSGATGGLATLPHFAPRAKRAIYLFMAGAPSQMDLFDYKPTMGRLV